MNFLESIRGALGSIASNKLRSGLTMLGIIIGVGSVVLMVAIGHGAQASVTSRIQSLGTNLLTISPGSPNQTNVRGAGGGQASTSLSADDVAAVESVSGLKAISPEVRSRSQVISGTHNTSTTILGVVPDYSIVHNLNAAYGSFITASNMSGYDKVAVLGPQVLSTLFPGEPNPIGMEVRIGNTIFTVVGVTETKGQQGLTNSDDSIFIPLSTMQQRIQGSTTVGSISVSVTNASDMTSVQQIVTATLLNSHRITDVSKQDFTVLNQADALQTLNQVTAVFTLLLGGIAAISLLVGGIGVMNIMLVSVTERTREIGIRKAIGAKKKDILLQFLVESTVLSVLGGLIGILVSFVASIVVKSQFSLDATIDISTVTLAFLFSMGVGVFFGMLPAYKAASLKPINALRYE